MTKETRHRGGGLTAFLVLLLVANPILALGYWLGGSTVQHSNPAIPGWLPPVLALFCFYNFVFAIAIWNWRKWGVYGYGAISLITFVTSLAIGLPVLRTLPALLVLGILVLLVRPLWSNLK